MDHEQHEAIARWERRWLSVAGLMSLAFVILITIALATEGTHIAQRSSRAAPAQLTSLELFANPGVTALGPGRYRVAVVAQSFTFTPSEIRLPVGAEAEFYLTSRDVLHGFQIQSTAVNVEVIPGEVSYLRYTFDQPGEYRVSCNEYCGIGHQNMIAKVSVVPSSQLAQAEAAPAAAPGEAVFTANCAACHQANGQGVPGAFPPLAGHAADLAAADRSYPLAVVLHGLQGPISVAGTTYNGVMPAWGQLSDEQIAEVLNYITTGWDSEAALGEGFAPYTADEVAVERANARTPTDVHALREQLGLE